MYATLTVVAGPDTGREFRLSGHATFLVGRAPDCHFRPGYDDPFICPRHFLIEVSPPRARAIELTSKAGMKVNGHKVEEADLADGDEVRAGQTVFRLSLPPAPAPPKATLAARTEEAVALSLDPPQVPGFELARELGRGALGTVYLGRRTTDGAHVAIRTIRPVAGTSQESIDRFLTEMGRLADVRHAHIVQTGKGGTVGPLVYVVTELVPGPSARNFVTERGAVSVRAGVLMMIQALEGLAHAHSLGFVHGEVNPSNLVIGKYDNRRRVKVSDFGLATAFDEARLGGPTLLGEAGGSLAFRAPERLTHAREPHPKMDQYSAAATLYYLLTGQPPYDLPAASGRAVAKVVGEDPVPIRKRKADVPEAVASAIHRALTRDPAARFGDALAFRQALLEGPGGK